MSQMEFVLMASNYDGSIMVDVSFRSGTKVEVMMSASRPWRTPFFRTRTLRASP